MTTTAEFRLTDEQLDRLKYIRNDAKIYERDNEVYMVIADWWPVSGGIVKVSVVSGYKAVILQLATGGAKRLLAAYRGKRISKQDVLKAKSIIESMARVRP